MTPTDVFIKSLVEDCKPVRPLEGTLRTSTLLSALGFAFSIVALFVIGKDDHTDITLPYFWIGETVIIALLAISCVWASLSLRIPGTEVTRPWLVPMVLFGFWCAYVISALFAEGLLSADHAVGSHQGFECGIFISLLLLAPTFGVIKAVLRGLPTAERWTVCVAAMAGGAFATLAIQFHCPYHTFAHHIAYHIGPVALYGVLGWVLGPVLLKRKA